MKNHPTIARRSSRRDAARNSNHESRITEHEFKACLLTSAATAFVFLLFTAAGVFAAPAPALAESKSTVLLVVGAPGEEEFGKTFADSAASWEKATRVAGARPLTLGLKKVDGASDHDRLKQLLADEPKDGPLELWLVLIGHGTFDGKEAKFNLQGPDVTATELAEWLKPFRRPVAVINCASSSGPFLNKLSAAGRVVITSTRSGTEQNYARFGEHFAAAIANPEADLDKDGQTSLLEAFLFASSRVAEYYKTEGRLATEHPLLDDNGDGLGTPPDWFRGIRAVKRAKEGASLDGLRAHQFHLVRSEQEQRMPADVRAKRDELELEIERLRDSKAALGDAEYYAKLEPLLLSLARLYEPAKQKP